MTFRASMIKTLIFIAAANLMAAGSSVLAQTDASSWRAPEVFIDKGGIFSPAWTHAVDGTDVVAYFSAAPDTAPIAGSPEFEARYKGARWLFSSAENLALFEADPAAYAPQYGGYCAWAIAEGKPAKGDPRYWHLRDGKLYLNVSQRIKNRWLSDLPGYIARADANWPDVLDR